MGEQKESAPKSDKSSPKKDNPMITLVLRFIIFFGISFFLLSLPYGQRPIFYVLHQGVSKVIVKLTGTNYYKPTFKTLKDNIKETVVDASSEVSENANENIKDTVDETKSRLSAPVENVRKNTKKIFNQGVFFKPKAEHLQKTNNE